ncbi:hypothetical protein Tco_1071263, partial [Tanacetum coccineum]
MDLRGEIAARKHNTKIDPSSIQAATKRPLKITFKRKQNPLHAKPEVISKLESPTKHAPKPEVKSKLKSPAKAKSSPPPRNPILRSAKHAPSRQLHSIYLQSHLPFSKEGGPVDVDGKKVTVTLRRSTEEGGGSGRYAKKKVCTWWWRLRRTDLKTSDLSTVESVIAFRRNMKVVRNDILLCREGWSVVLLPLMILRGYAVIAHEKTSSLRSCTPPAMELENQIGNIPTSHGVYLLLRT